MDSTVQAAAIAATVGAAGILGSLFGVWFQRRGEAERTNAEGE
jgi:hypothetical protein